MINDIINAISIRLYEAFGDGYKIYLNDIKQGLTEPCFLITVVDYSKEPLLQSRSKRLVPFDILFFPNNGKSQCHEVADQMMNELDTITLLNSDMMHGTEMRAEIVDDVLHFFVNYNFIAKVEKEQEDSMETLNIQNSTKE